MRKITFFTTGMVLLLLHCGLFGIANADNTDTQVVTYIIDNIAELEVTGTPTMQIVAPAAGDQPADDTDATTSYALTINGVNKKVTGQITTGGNMPDDTTLAINLAVPSGASEGATLLSTVAADLTNSMTPIADADSAITYVFHATVDADPIPAPGAAKTITLTVADD
jgi:hypothetical protein